MHAIAFEVEADALGLLFADSARGAVERVHVFRVLSVALRALEAPLALIGAARRAADDKVRHARAIARLARRFGAEPGMASSPPPARALVELAVDAAVRESWSALVTTC